MDKSIRNLEAALATLEQRFRDAGVPLTVQRRAVVEALLARTDHPTADDIFGVVSEKLPGVSKATVYRTLDTLVEYGVAARVGHPGASARFDPNLSRHHHLICDGCGSILDVQQESLNELPLPKTAGFQVRDYSIHFRGVCDRCAEEEATANS